MAEIKATTLSLMIDNRRVDIESSQKLSAELSKALDDASNFRAFAADPAKFAASRGLTIDKDIASQLSAKLKGFNSVEELQRANKAAAPATVWAIAVGHYSVTTTKIAVAF
jgi:hypothetical protein